MSIAGAVHVRNVEKPHWHRHRHTRAHSIKHTHTHVCTHTFSHTHTLTHTLTHTHTKRGLDGLGRVVAMPEKAVQDVVLVGGNHELPQWQAHACRQPGTKHNVRQRARGTAVTGTRAHGGKRVHTRTHAHAHTHARTRAHTRVKQTHAWHRIQQGRCQSFPWEQRRGVGCLAQPPLHRASGSTCRSKTQSEAAGIPLLLFKHMEIEYKHKNESEWGGRGGQKSVQRACQSKQATASRV